MSEFEKELDTKIKSGEIMKEKYKTGRILSNFVNLKDIESTFKDWQPPKPLVVVPQFVSDWFDINQDDIDGNIKALTTNIHRKLKSEWSEMDGWFMYNHNKPIETLIRMKLDGYTVKKERKYILKHIDMSKQHECASIYVARDQDSKLQHKKYSVNVDISEIKQCHFTQSEIDKLNIGSYEQIEVKVEE